MLTLPQCAHTDTKETSSSPVPENPLANAFLSKEKKNRYTKKCAVHYCFYLTIAAEARTEAGRDSNALGSGCRMVCVTPTGEGTCISQGTVFGFCTLIPSYLEASDSSLPDPPPQLDSKGDRCRTDSKLQFPHVQHDSVARLLHC